MKTHASAGFFRSLAFLYRKRAELLRNPEPLTAAQRELMAKLFDALANNAAETAKVIQEIQDISNEDPPDMKSFSFKKKAIKRA